MNADRQTECLGMYIKALEIDSPVTAPSFWTERFTNTNIFFSSDMQLLKNYMSAAAFRQQFFSSIPIYARQTFGFLLGCRITVNPINYFSKTCSSGKTAQRHKLLWTYCVLVSPWPIWWVHDHGLRKVQQRWPKFQLSQHKTRPILKDWTRFCICWDKQYLTYHDGQILSAGDLESVWFCWIEKLDKS